MTLLPEEGDYILVQFEGSLRNVYYVGKLIGDGSGSDMEVSYLKKCSKMKNGFIVSNIPIIATILMDHNKMILPKPDFSGGSKRQQGIYKLNLDFSRLNLR